MLDSLSSKNIIKYLIVVGILYTILKTMPTQKLSNKDIVLLLFIMMFIFITIDYKCFKNKSEAFTNVDLQNNIIKPLENLVNK
jgi:hypothetical protein